jgi:Flp pilus assembly protein TadB
MKALVCVLLVVGCVMVYWQYVLGVVVLVVGAWVVPFVVRQIHDEREATARRRADLVARADEQHAQVMQGDSRGVFGAYPPAVGTG